MAAENVNTRQKGRAAENAACRYLEQIGFVIIMRNYFTSFGEIDIIAENDNNTIFVEVKSRVQKSEHSPFGRPSSAVNKIKQQKIIASAKRYISEYKPMKKLRLDVIEIYIYPQTGAAAINHITGAFCDGD